jgi:hypothetical protein
MATGSPTNSLGANADDRDSCWSIASNGMPLGTIKAARYTTARSRFGTCSATADMVIPAAECPTRMTLPPLSDAASFTNATTACVRCCWVTPAMGDRSAANAAGSKRIGISNARPVQGCPQPFCVTSLMLRPSLGAAWLAWKIWPPVGFCAEPLAVAGPPSQRAAPPAWRPRRPSLQPASLDSGGVESISRLGQPIANPTDAVRPSNDVAYFADTRSSGG